MKTPLEHELRPPLPSAIRPYRIKSPSRWDFTAVTALFGVFTLGLMDPNYAVVRFVNSTKWGVFGLFLVFAFFRNSMNVRIQRNISTLLFLSLPLVGTIATALHLRHMTEAVERSASFLVLYAIAFIFVVPADPWDRLRMSVRSFTYVNGAVIWTSVALAGDPRFYHYGRFSGSTYHVVVMGAFGSLYALAMYGTVLAALPKLKLGPLVGMFAGIFCMIASGTRAELVATPIAASVLTLAFLSRRNAFITLSGVAALLLLFQSGIAVVNKVSATPVAERRFNISDRTGIWASQIRSFQESPWVGWGFEITGNDTGVGRTGAEGSYTELLTVSGVFGAIPFFAGLLYASYRYYKLVIASRSWTFAVPSDRLYLINGFGLLIYSLIASIPEDWLGSVGTPVTVFMWLAMGSVAGIQHSRRRVARHAPMPLRSRLVPTS